MKKQTLVEPTRRDFAIVKVVQTIKSCKTHEQLTQCKQLIRLLCKNYDIRYLTSRYILLRYKQQLYNLTKE